LNPDFAKNMLLLIGIAVGVGLVVTLLVFMGGSRSPKRYRPGRPFEFAPVWFLSAPEQQSRAGLSGPRDSGRQLVAGGSAGQGRVARPAETGGASDRW
jgi:hypothetical protein